MPITPLASHVLLEACLGVVVLGGGFLLGWWLRRVLRAPLRGQVDAAHKSARRLGELAQTLRRQIDGHRRELTETLNRLAGQADQGEAVSQGLRQLIESNGQLQLQLADAEKKLHEQAQTIEEYATKVRIDTLTQVMNRGAFDEELARRMAEWHRTGRPFCVLMADIDRFKAINDQHGHQAGDEVLQHVAQVLRGTMREMDVVARFGGDEFAVLLPDTNLAEAAAAAERLRRRVEVLRVPMDDASLSQTLSVGAAEVTALDDGESIVRRADEALYAAKAAGRNRSCYHDGTQTATMPLGGVSQGPMEIPTAPHPGYVSFLSDLQSRIAQCERTGEPLSVIVVQFSPKSASSSEEPRELGSKERMRIEEFFQGALREMDKCALMGGGRFGAILPGVNVEGAQLVKERLDGLFAQSSLPETCSVGSQVTSYLPGEDACAMLSRLDSSAGEQAPSRRRSVGSHLPV